MAQPENQNNRRKPSYSILIVDDDPSILKAFSTFFKRENFDVIIAKDGLEGENLFRHNPTDVVISDINVPKKDGIDLTLSLKIDFPTVIIVVTTGGGHWDTEFSMDAAKAMGATIVLRKPINHKALLKSILEYLTQIKKGV